ncbi:GA-binding protein subunit beta-2-like isoform X2 [Lineus longissimus]|uniref:GA-binding protein subunit beta-2-like isoform X2 n=1 Tax=Lineus longissimus TaxID=88925 RepID=UPI00315DC5C4
MKGRPPPHFLRPRAYSYSKDKAFKIKVKLHTDEVFHVNNVSSDMKISELKGQVEFACGIPYHLQKLHYLDDGDLLDLTDIRHNDIVPGATLHLEVWYMWKTLVDAVAANDVDWVFKLGVTQDTDYRTPNLDYMTMRSRQVWLAERAFIALYMAAHRGNMKMVEKLVTAGADVNAKTPMGRTALHVAAARGNGKIIDLLLEKGANINETDNDGNTALNIASKMGHKDCERHLFLFQWQQRAASLKPEFQNLPRMAHQYSDSKFPVWLDGKQTQIYYTQILPPGEFEGTVFHSPKRRHRPSSAPLERKKGKGVRKKKVLAENVQVELGKETLMAVKKEDEKANQHKHYLASLLTKTPNKKSRATTATATLDDLEEEPPLSADPATRRLMASNKVLRMKQVPDDTELYGLVDIDDPTAKEQLRASRFGRQKAYNMIYGYKRKSTPKSFDDWLVQKKDREARIAEIKKAEHDEKKQNEDDKKEIKQLEAEKVKRADSAKKKSYDNWMAQKEAAEKARVAAATGQKVPTGEDEQDVTGRIRNLLKSYADKEMSAYDMWLMRKEVETLEKVAVLD